MSIFTIETMIVDFGFPSHVVSKSLVYECHQEHCIAAEHTKEEKKM